MTNKEKIKSIYFWQNVGVVHELTCRDCGGHTKLAPLIRDEEIVSECPRGLEIVLECPKCRYIQEYIPDGLFSYVKRATTKRWEAIDATDEAEIRMEVVISFLKEEIICNREKSILVGIDLSAVTTFEEFINNTDQYDMQVLIKDFFGDKILSQVKKVIKRFEKRKIMYSKILSNEEQNKILY